MSPVNSEICNSRICLSVSCDVFAGDDYLYISMRGYENNLPEACQLLARQILMPKLDEKQLSRIKGSILGSRIDMYR